MRYYAIYERKTDRLLASGSAAFCTRQLGIASIRSFYCMVGRIRSGKIKKYEILIEDISEEEENG